MHMGASAASILAQVGLVVTRVADTGAILKLYNSIHLPQHVAVVRNNQHGHTRLGLHPANKPLLGSVVHVVGRLIDQGQVGFGMHDFDDFYQPLLPARKLAERRTAQATKPKVRQRSGNFFFYMVKTLLAKALQCLGVFGNFAHIAAHCIGVGVDNVA